MIRKKWVPVFPKRSCSSKKMERAALLAATTFRKRSGLVCGQRLSDMLVRAPAHFPEVGFEPGGFLEDCDQLCLAGWRGVAIGESFQLRPRFRRDLLVGCTGIFGDPDVIWVGCSERIRSRGEPRRDLGVADHAGGKRHLEC